MPSICILSISCLSVSQILKYPIGDVNLCVIWAKQSIVYFKEHYTNAIYSSVFPEIEICHIIHLLCCDHSSGLLSVSRISKSTKGGRSFYSLALE